MGFTRAELESYRDAEIDDLVGPGLRLLFVGINPGLWTAATNTPFAYPGNRFYPALYVAGITTHLIQAADGFSDADRAHLIDRGVGISNLVRRATARADELTRDELRAGGERLVETVERLRPPVVALVGITAYRAAFGRSKAVQGLQSERMAGAELWVLPNPSGLNAHDTVSSLGAAYREAAIAAGIVHEGDE